MIFIMSHFQRLVIEFKQTKSILKDFLKSKTNCQMLSEQLKQPITTSNWKQFQDLERQSQIKIRISDQRGLVSLKSRLSSALTQILDIEQQLKFKSERKQARKQFLPYRDTENNYRQKQRSKANVQINPYEAQQRGSNNKSIKEANSPNQENVKAKEQMPFYVMRNDTVQNKIDNISKFIACLKKNMKKKTENTSNFMLKQVLMGQPQYLKVKQQLERYKMRVQQLEQMLQKRVQYEVQNYIKKCQFVQQNSNFKIIKIKKGENQEQGERRQKSQSPQDKTILEDQNILAELEVTYQQRQQDRIDINQVNRRVDDDFEDIKRRLEQNGDYLQGIFQKLKENVKENQQNLIQLREKRKKTFIGDDVWDQMEKM